MKKSGIAPEGAGPVDDDTKLLETMRTTPERGSGEGPSTSPIEEERTTNPFMSKLATECKVLEIELDAIKFPMQEL
jgi:hypothetical protein